SAAMRAMTPKVFIMVRPLLLSWSWRWRGLLRLGGGRRAGREALPDDVPQLRLGKDAHLLRGEPLVHLGHRRGRLLHLLAVRGLPEVELLQLRVQRRLVRAVLL